ncbi:aldo/keto reductase [Wolinella succinogenes]|uniref:NADP-dependent oxidoreductase domain-containing protein n=1 Tax=Wolinella succinogenes (strain ATCC 29543 / DSM 1740 / CCUG 13145 / JCM 31913 / LMG 7466 / NCTC 11488 / FDC 602W) TaxID=273121 RepID=Q7MRF4_WOLSU|nr:aldo/keto reductase [Wolinella succinogenes]CAE10464.1 conserved hypothetical protein [Wolinella succinogenes]VEG80607.1 D-threo-aldose 1-dehydrogenase [Wolinella succinogenes]
MRIKGCATAESTKAYAAHFAQVDGFYKIAQGLTFSSLGVGSFAPEAYKEENYLYTFKEPIKEAVLNGINHIDTAASYRYNQSEREIGEALGELLEMGTQRESLIIASKGGFFPLEYPFPNNPYTWIKERVIKPNLAQESDIFTDEYCLSPDYLRWSLERSLENLGLEKLDIFYLQNPEHALGHLTKKELLSRLEKVFCAMESWVSEGLVSYFGIASWNGFLNDPTHLEYLSLQEIVNMAQKITNDSHLKFVQIPYNLAKIQGVGYANQAVGKEGYYPAFIAAQKLGLHSITSSSLLRLHLFKRPFSEEFRALCGKEAMSDLQRALQFSRSNPYALSALFSTKNADHLLHNMELKMIKPLSKEAYFKLFSTLGRDRDAV